jgi:hypothetical protein
MKSLCSKEVFYQNIITECFEECVIVGVEADAIIALSVS